MNRFRNILPAKLHPRRGTGAAIGPKKVRLPFLLLLLAWAVLSPFPRGLGLAIGTCSECSIEFAALEHPHGCCDADNTSAPLEGEHGHCEHITMDDPLGRPSDPPTWTPAAPTASPQRFDFETLHSVLLQRRLLGLDPPPDLHPSQAIVLQSLGESLALRC